mmetsp:Transcript_36145/g.81375  ORF Transcript_36145/g.81375 Transcript_36145/m.81375 type:complete len:91 (-) Transcript_36145:772-1044(-)
MSCRCSGTPLHDSSLRMGLRIANLLQNKTEFLLLSLEQEGSAESNKKEINHPTRRGCLSNTENRRQELQVDADSISGRFKTTSSILQILS